MCLLGLGVGAAQADRYVATNGPQTAPFTTWATAASNMQTAISAATNGETVWVSNGYYRITNQVAVSNRITVRGFNGYTNTIVYGAFPATNVRVFYVTGTGAVDNFTISNGYCGSNEYVGGGGVCLIDSGQLKNCLLVNNICSNSIVNTGGGGAYVSNGFINNCLIFNNNAFTNPGGGVYIANNGFVSNSVIAGNRCGGSPGGGGIYLAGLSGTAQIDACRISNNLCEFGAGGGGVLATNYGQLRNCLVNHNTNTAGNGGGVHFGNVTGTLYGALNCTIAYNYSTNEGGGLAAVGPSNYIANCIIYSNRSASNNFPDVYATDNNTNHFYYCCTPATLAAGRGNITNNPLFAVSGDPRLQAASPCVNTGTNQSWMTSGSDLDGRARIRYGTVDMGAYERAHEAAVYNFH